jgi:hypothetical protein
VMRLRTRACMCACVNGSRSHQQRVHRCCLVVRALASRVCSCGTATITSSRSGTAVSAPRASIMMTAWPSTAAAPLVRPALR